MVRLWCGGNSDAPHGTSKEIVARLQTEISKALGGADVKSRLDSVGCEPFKSSPDQFAELIKSDVPRWAKTVEESGATVD